MWKERGRAQSIWVFNDGPSQHIETHPALPRGSAEAPPLLPAPLSQLPSGEHPAQAPAQGCRPEAQLLSLRTGSLPPLSMGAAATTFPAPSV